MDNQLLVMAIDTLYLFFQLFQNFKFSSFMLLVMVINTPFLFQIQIIASNGNPLPLSPFSTLSELSELNFLTIF
jgi:hypothetical protein